ncbi:FoF1 ATP synthase subunit delta/epsilon [Spiroplasma platyhelix]|uniref:ATP synthase epsilon chain n=1 Tax=Spiroplasma platyhelix PALS-1 TaxID=1276218 RepID=A0A846U1B6_9MOLU|nr:F0F1 ATP synthase subunit epsilon [Spiroplasma platyhelix]MBE4704233.1 ATP synthase epsilon chain [Spiroplasma platyhelix PALS-1]NKE38606.1 F0F1 ATP synthase subunit epsilon [Spiroplasma platyhelix PALS-1]UJB28817.1 F0F1 ATP synthase subunit epsilon [Spiroplasma platyhelix PALS-1]
MALKLKIITPDGIFFDGTVDSVNIKTTEGYITILEWHTPLIANIAISNMMYRINNQPHNLSIAGGLLITTLHDVRIITDKIDNTSGVKNQASISEKKDSTSQE